MGVSRFQLAFAFVFLSPYSEARVAQPHVVSEKRSAFERRTPDEDSRVSQRRPSEALVERQLPNSTSVIDWASDDLYKNILDDGEPGEIQSFCNIWLAIPPKTEVVDYTPTTTMTRSASTTATDWITDRIVVTETVYEPATTPRPSIIPRGVAAAYTILHQVITNVVEGGINATGTAPAVAVTGLSRGCSIKNVDPTSTVTSTFTAPPVQTILGMNRMRLVTSTTTRTYTTTATVSADIVTESVRSSNVAAVSTANEVSTASNLATTTSSVGSVIGLISREVNPTITPGPSVSLVRSGSPVPTDSVAGQSRPVVIGIPFSCPTNDHQSPRLIVGDLQYRYTVLCNTAIVASSPIATIPDLENEFACVAECSLINNKAQKSICAAAVFTPIPGANTGSCLINGPVSDTDLIARPGTTTVLLAGVSSKSEDCDSLDLNNGPQGVTIDTSSLVAAVTSAGFSLSIPNLVNQTETGGASGFESTSTITDSAGFVHVNWHKEGTSSSMWWKVYESSWACSTAVAHPEPIIVTSSGTVITSGFQSVSSTAEAGSNAQILVPIATSIVNEGFAVFTSAGQTATGFTTEGSDVIAPLPSAPSSAGLINATGSQGEAAAFTTSGATYSFNSTDGGEIITPSQTQSGSTVSSESPSGDLSPPETNGTIRETLSGSTATSNSTGGATVETPPASTASTEAVTFLTSSATATSNSTGGAALETPSASSEVQNSPTQTSTSSFKFTPGSGGYAEQTTSEDGAYVAETASGGGGYAEETTSETGGYAEKTNSESDGYAEETSSLVISSAANSTTPAQSSGNAQVTISSAFVTGFTTGGEIVLTPSASLNQTVLPTGSILSGSQNFTTAGNTFTASTIGREDVISPAPGTSGASNSPTLSTGPIGTGSLPYFGANSTGSTPSPEVPSSTDEDFTNSDDARLRRSRSRSTAMPPTGSLNSSVPFPTATAPASQASSGIPPASNFAFALSTGVIQETTSNVAASQAPSASVNFTETVPASVTPSASLEESETGGFNIWATSGETESTAVASETVTITVTQNFTVPLTPSSSPSLSANGSIVMGTEIFSISSESIAFSALSGGNIATPSLNSTAGPISSAFPTASVNVSVSTGTAVYSTFSVTNLVSAASGGEVIPPTNSTLPPTPSSTPSPSVNASIASAIGSGVTVLSLSTSGTAIVTPPANDSASASITPVPSLNSLTVDDSFTNSDDARRRSRRSTSRANSAVSSTIPVGTGTTLPANLSSTFASATSTSGTKAYYGYGEAPSDYPDESITSSTTMTTDVSQPSITLPPASLNSSTTGPLVDMSTDSFNPNDDERRRRSRSSSPSGFVPSLTLNATLPGATAPLTSAGALPTPSTNFTASVPFGTSGSAALNSTSLPIGTGNGISLAGTNVTSTGTGGSALETPFANSTAPLATGETPTPTESEGDTPFTLQEVNESSLIPSESANSTGWFPTGVTAPPPSLPTPPVNITSLPSGTGSSAVSAPSVNPTSVFDTTFTAPASSTPTPLGNNSVPVGTGSSNFSTPSTNSSLPVGTGATGPTNSTASTTVSGGSTGFPIPSFNITIPASLLSANPTSCPSVASSTTVRTTEVTTVITQIVTELVPAAPATCVPTASSVLWANNTLPTGTGAPPLPISEYNSYTFDASTPTPLPPPPRRRTGEIATPEQIAYACADTDNAVLNSNFDSDPTSDWTIAPEDATISFTTVSATTLNGTTTTAARVQAGAPGRTLTASQPLTLCPRRQYTLRSVNRQANMLSKCEVAYYIGNDWKFTAGSQEQWLRSSTFFTAGETAQDISVDLRIVARCAGEAGMLVGADEDGFMAVEFDDVAVVPDLEG